MKQHLIDAIRAWHASPGPENSTRLESVIDAACAAVEQPTQHPHAGDSLTPAPVPAAFMESPYGAIRANPLYQLTAPRSIFWSIPLYPITPAQVAADQLLEALQQATEDLAGLASFLAGWKLSNGCKNNGLESQVDSWIGGVHALFAAIRAAGETS